VITAAIRERTTLTTNIEEIGAKIREFSPRIWMSPGRCPNHEYQVSGTKRLKNPMAAMARPTQMSVVPGFIESRFFGWRIVSGFPRACADALCPPGHCFADRVCQTDPGLFEFVPDH